MYGKLCKISLASVMLIGLAAGCSGKSSEPAGDAADKPKSTEPVTLTLYSMPAFDKDAIQKNIIDPVTRKFPHISFNVLPSEGLNQDATFQKFMSAGVIPDITMTNYATVRILQDMKISMDLSELLKKNKVDTSKFNTQAIEALKMYNGGKGLVALPYFLNLQTLMYNKDLFDKFGVPYPVDGLTWKEAAEMAKRLTNTIEGIQYLGLNPGRPYVLSAQLDQQWVDPKTGKSAVNTEGWKTIFDTMKDIYSIPGNLPANINEFWNINPTMMDKKVQAMSMVWWDALQKNVNIMQRNGNSFNWDIVTTPVFDSGSKKGPNLDQFVWSISAQSKHQDAAFDVINYLTSEEMQTTLAKSGYIPSLTDDKVRKSLGGDNPALQGKNIQSLFKIQYSMPMVPVIFDANMLMNVTYEDVMYKNVDVNTALRKLDEAMNKAIEESTIKNGS
ncbi:extracellular solute-binding protein [Paenibacillus sp. NPDC056579]|uniref:ABC transporter substrate-binding protein n=1 Tax=Paenibacillus sp. NPDC056579 TaxID=3345871 RepID=UPI0036957D69